MKTKKTVEIRQVEILAPGTNQAIYTLAVEILPDTHERAATDRPLDRDRKRITLSRRELAHAFRNWRAKGSPCSKSASAPLAALIGATVMEGVAALKLQLGPA